MSLNAAQVATKARAPTDSESRRSGIFGAGEIEPEEALATKEEEEGDAEELSHSTANTKS